MLKYGVLFLILLSAENAIGQLPVAHNGVLDLRSQSFSEEPLTMSGEWNFYWNQFLEPGAPLPAKTALVPYPSLWADLKVDGKRLPSKGYASYHLLVLLPKQHGPLSIEIPSVYSAYSCYLNGTLVATNGRPGKTAGQSRPNWVTRMISLPDHTDSVSILLQVSNFWHAKGGLFKGMLIGDSEIIAKGFEEEMAYGFMMAGCLFMGGLFFLGLFLFGRRDKTILYFALFCIVYSYRLVGTDPYVLHSLFPHFNWFIAIRLEYFTIVLSVAFFALYNLHLYREYCHEAIMKVLLVFCFIYMGTIAWLPVDVFTSLFGVFLGVMVVYILYACYVYINAAKHHHIGSIYALISCTVLLLLFSLTILSFLKIIPPLKLLVLFAYISFFFFQSLALSHRFAHSFKMAALQAQEGLQAKAEFLSTMSHEIRTPLNVVIGMAHLLKQNRPREDQKQNLDVLHFSANNLLSIVNNILDYNKIEAGKISFESIPMDLAEIAGNIISGLKSLAEEKNIRLELSVNAQLNRKLLGDPTRTSQVINNLVHNAIKFTERGYVSLSLGVEFISEVSVTVLVTVRDTGIGIEHAKQQIIFDRFTQADSTTSRSYGGTGLGLAITKRILNLQGIQLKLESEPGKGSLFYFAQTFNWCREQELSRPASTDSTKNPGLLQGLSILLVEDNPVNVLVAQTILEAKGASIEVATNGQEALDKLNHHKHKLILMDLQMPVLDGYKATEQFRRNGETVPIIALTASAAMEVESEVYASGLNDIVVKPFNPDDLFRIILHYTKKAV